MILLGWVLIHFLWQGCLIGAGTAAILPFLHRASTRYLFLCLALLACPLYCLITAGTYADSQELLSTEPPPTTTVSNDIFAVPPSSEEQPFEPVQSAIPWLVSIWAMGVVFISVRLVADWLHLRRCVRAGRAIDLEHRVLTVLDSVSQSLGVKKAVLLLESHAVEVPMLIGWLRPTVLLPAHFLTGLQIEQIEAILAHELAHIRRNDFMFNGVQIVIETLLYYHPMVSWISHRIREERENCCDDLAIGAMGNRAVYAGALLALEEGRGRSLQLAANGGSLVKRIRRIAHGPERELRGLLLPVLAGMVLFLLGLFSCLNRAEAEPPLFRVSLVQPVPELLSTPKLPRKFRIVVSLEGPDLMHVLDVPAGTNNFMKDLSEAPACHKIDLSKTVGEGDSVSMENSRVFPYSVTFHQPVLLYPAGFTAIIPMTPSEFKQVMVGWNLQIQPTVSGGFINLRADAFFTKAKMMTKAVYGENTDPIYASVKASSNKNETVLMTQNLSYVPSFETTHTPFYLFAKPDKDYHVKLQQGTEWIDATIRVEIVR